jgi:hypothetical protein
MQRAIYVEAGHDVGAREGGGGPVGLCPSRGGVPEGVPTGVDDLDQAVEGAGEASPPHGCGLTSAGPTHRLDYGATWTWVKPASGGMKLGRVSTSSVPEKE